MFTHKKVCLARNHAIKWNEGCLRTRTEGGAMLCLRGGFVYLRCKQARLPGWWKDYTPPPLFISPPKARKSDQKGICVFSQAL